MSSRKHAHRQAALVLKRARARAFVFALPSVQDIYGGSKTRTHAAHASSPALFRFVVPVIASAAAACMHRYAACGYMYNITIGTQEYIPYIVMYYTGFYLVNARDELRALFMCLCACVCLHRIEDVCCVLSQICICGAHRNASVHMCLECELLFLC